MNILLDPERMAILHKHNDINVLTNVAWIECHTIPYCIFPIDDATFFKGFTDMELKILFRNVTGADDHSFSRSQLLQVLFDLSTRIPESDIDPFEVEAQAEYIKADDKHKWLYVRGARRPKQKLDAFEPACKQALRSDIEERRAKSGKLPALQPTAVPPSKPPGNDQPAANRKVLSKQSNGPKRGTARAVIWQVADTMWEENGKPTDKKEVLNLRKQIMDRLETEENIKRASASSELGQWQKTRAPS